MKISSQGEINLTVQHSTVQSPVTLQGGTLPKENLLVISVSDTWIGISKDKQQVIFDAFQQADGTTNRRYGGTGLGLSISRRLAKLLGGDLQLHSEEGKGSTFTLYLRENQLVKTAFPPANNQSESASNHSESTNEISNDNRHPKPIEKISDDRHELKSTNQSILIMEDDREFAKILLELARERQFSGYLLRQARYSVPEKEVGSKPPRFWKPRSGGF